MEAQTETQPRPTTWAEPPKPGRNAAAELLDAVEMSALPVVAPQPTQANGSDYAGLLALLPAAERDRKKMLQSARWVGEQMGEDAIYRFPMGGQEISGASIDLAYALATEWGSNATRCLIVERSATKAKFRGEFIDLLSRTITVREYVHTLSPPPGKFAEKPEQRARWETMQEQAAASKSIRGAILAGLPAWFVTAALRGAEEAVSSEALNGGSLEQAIAAGIATFDDLKVGLAVLEEHIGRPRELWTLGDVVELRGAYKAIRRGETSPAAMFAAARERLAAKARGAAVQGEQRPAVERAAERLGMATAPKAAEQPAAPAQPDPIRASIAATAAEVRSEGAQAEPPRPVDPERQAALSVLRGLFESDRQACEAIGMTTMRGIAGASLDAIQERIDKLREWRRAHPPTAQPQPQPQQTLAPARPREPGDDDEIPFPEQQ